MTHMRNAPQIVSAMAAASDIAHRFIDAISTLVPMLKNEAVTAVASHLMCWLACEDRSPEQIMAMTAARTLLKFSRSEHVDVCGPTLGALARLFEASPAIVSRLASPIQIEAGAKGEETASEDDHLATSMARVALRSAAQHLPAALSVVSFCLGTTEACQGFSSVVSLESLANMLQNLVENPIALSALARIFVRLSDRLRTTELADRFCLFFPPICKALLTFNDPAAIKNTTSIMWCTVGRRIDGFARDIQNLVASRFLADGESSDDPALAPEDVTAVGAWSSAATGNGNDAVFPCLVDRVIELYRGSELNRSLRKSSLLAALSLCMYLREYAVSFKQKGLYYDLEPLFDRAATVDPSILEPAADIVTLMICANPDADTVSALRARTALMCTDERMGGRVLRSLMMQRALMASLTCVAPSRTDFDTAVAALRRTDLTADWTAVDCVSLVIMQQLSVASDEIASQFSEACPELLARCCDSRRCGRFAPHMAAYSLRFGQRTARLTETALAVAIVCLQYHFRDAFAAKGALTLLDLLRRICPPDSISLDCALIARALRENPEDESLFEAALATLSSVEHMKFDPEESKLLRRKLDASPAGSDAWCRIAIAYARAMEPLHPREELVSLEPPSLECVAARPADHIGIQYFRFLPFTL
jgi:hypothetical protein